MTVVRRAAAESPSAKHPLTQVRTPRGLTSLQKVLDEMDTYVAVLMGNQDPPWDNGTLTMQEVGFAYFSRACEIEALIYRGEREGRISTGSEWYKFRTGELRSYLSLFKRAFELGKSRTYDAGNFSSRGE